METASIDQYELEYDGEYFKIFVPDYWIKIYRGQKKEPLYHDYRLMLDVLKKVDKSKYVLDIGANHGLFAIPAAKMGYKVFGFEPVAVNIETLKMAKEANGLNDFDMFHLALSNVNDEIDIYVPECPDNSSFSSTAAVSNMKGKEFNVEKVVSVRFDDWIKQWKNDYRNVGFIKIDVQGAEYIVFQGMADFLRNANDIWMVVEYEDHLIKMGHTFEELDNLLMAYGFNFVDYLSPNDKIWRKD
jgi:FkbM family methyltransferase